MVYRYQYYPHEAGRKLPWGYIYIYIRPFSSIELACAVRQPGPCVRAFCESGVLFHMSHLKLHFALRTSHFTLLTALFTLHTSHFTLHTSHFTLHSSHSTLHTSHTSHFTVHTSHFSLLSSHSTLHTSHFTLHTSHCTLHAPHFTLAHFISSELFSPYPSSSLLISSLPPMGNMGSNMQSQQLCCLPCAGSNMQSQQLSQTPALSYSVRPA